ncbi:hypothetical protein J7E49_12440 [Variovorax paradoxus]|nr:hypothetical protein [Variovorax paradoxus]
MKAYIASRERPSRHATALCKCCNMHIMDTRPSFPSWWRAGALAYTAAGVVCVVSSAAFPQSEMAMLAAIAGALPWSLALLTLDLAPGVAQTALLLLAGSWTVNAGLLWWRALRHATHRRPAQDG